MKCDRCRDSGFVFPENFGDLVAKTENESWDAYEIRQLLEASKLFCDCKLGMKMLFINKKAAQMMRKQNEEPNERS